MEATKIGALGGGMQEKPLSLISKQFAGAQEDDDVGVNSVKAFERVFQGKDNANCVVASVCAIVESDGERNITGTGVLIGDSWILTCNHVLGSIPAMRRHYVQFGYADPPGGKYGNVAGKGVWEFDTSDHVENFFGVSGPVDFSICKLKPYEGRIRPWPSASTFACTMPATQARKDIPKDHERVSIIHHLLGRPKTVCFGGNVTRIFERVDTGAISYCNVDHNLYTNGGSSGAPVFDHNLKWVSLHRADTSETRGDYDGEAVANRSVSVLRIAQCIARRFKDEDWIRANTPALSGFL